MKAGVIIVNAGRGRRFGGADKAVFALKGKPLFLYSVDLFKRIKAVRQIVLVLRREHFKLAEKKAKGRKVFLVQGGRERKDSVCRGLSALGKEIDYVLIHDGARPFVTEKIVLDILTELRRHPAVICGVKAKDTVKITRGHFVKKTVKRETVFLAQTPQGFKKDLILAAYRCARRKKFTDDAQYLERSGKRIKVIEVKTPNFKITYPEDLGLAKAMIRTEDKRPKIKKTKNR